MATVYETMVKYCERRDKAIPIRSEREKIGFDIRMKWARLSTDEEKQIVNKVKISEVDGSFWVNNYPDSFSPVIENMIHKYYLSLPFVKEKKKMRKRIPIKSQTKVYSTR